MKKEGKTVFVDFHRLSLTRGGWRGSRGEPIAGIGSTGPAGMKHEDDEIAPFASASAHSEVVAGGIRGRVCLMREGLSKGSKDGVDDAHGHLVVTSGGMGRLAIYKGARRYDKAYGHEATSINGNVGKYMLDGHKAAGFGARLHNI